MCWLDFEALWQETERQKGPERGRHIIIDSPAHSSFSLFLIIYARTHAGVELREQKSVASAKHEPRGSHCESCADDGSATRAESHTTPDGRYDSQSLYVLRLEQVEKQAIELSSVQFSSVQTEV